MLTSIPYRSAVMCATEVYMWRIGPAQYVFSEIHKSVKMLILKAILQQQTTEMIVLRKIVNKTRRDRVQNMDIIGKCMKLNK